MRKQEDKIDPVRSKFGKIEKEEVSLSDKMVYLEQYAMTHPHFSFRSLLEAQCGKMEIIVTFLAVLELMKMGKITRYQNRVQGCSLGSYYMRVVMEEKNYEAIIEAILFTMGESVELDKIANAIELDKQETKKKIEALRQKYEQEERGIQIIELDGAYQMCTKNEMYEYLIRIAKQPKKRVLTDVLLETLSIIAYKQPITKAEIEKIRGVSCDHAVSKLVEYNLVNEVGRLDAPGRPMLFGTTEEFLRSFGVHSIDELPVLNEDQVEEFKHQAEQEAEMKLEV